MWSKRQEVDYALQRRNTLRTLQGPRRAFARAEACDAEPPLVRAALHHGEPHPVDCPVCGRSQMVVLNHVFGEQLGQYSGRIKSSEELDAMQNEYGAFKVCVVEVCHACGWNHMIKSYLLGDGVERKTAPSAENG